MSDEWRSTCPIIVGGCHRSGTSLLRRILDSHPSIHCGPEVKFFRDFFGDYGARDPLAGRRFFATAKTILPPDEVFLGSGELFVRFHELAAANAGKRRWADKNPENVQYLKAWEKLIGDQWLFVNVVRNPLDTLSSMIETGWADFPPDLDGRVAHYLRFLEAGLEFRRQNPERHYLLVYEDLVTNARAALEGLASWLGEEFDEQMLEFGLAEHQEGVEDPKVRSTGEVHASSLGRWRTDLDEDEAYTILGACAPRWLEIDPDGRWLRAAGVGEDIEVLRTGFGPSMESVRRRPGSAHYLAGPEVATVMGPPGQWQQVELDLVPGSLTLHGESRLLSFGPVFPARAAPPRGPWQYAIVFQLRLDPSPAHVLRIEASLGAGRAAFGSQAGSSQDFAYRTHVEAEAGRVTVDLPLPRSPVCSVVVQAGDTNDPVELFIEDLELFAAPPAGRSSLSVEAEPTGTRLPLNRADGPDRPAAGRRIRALLGLAFRGRQSR
jgi:hypothetical protein